MTRAALRTARVGTLLVLGAAATAGCADLGDLTGLDGSVGPREDGGVASSDGGAVPSEPESPDAAPGVCYDGLDNDQDGTLDCADDACATDALCCVGSSHADCCSADATFTADFDVVASGCDEVSVDLCPALAGFGAFGDGLPRIESGALVPQGGLGHGGVELAQALDARAQNLVVSADVVLPPAESRCSDCIDAAGIALIRDRPALGQPAEIEVGILLSGSREQLLLYLHDEVVGRVDVEPGVSRVEIRTMVDGRAQLITPTSNTPLDAGALGPLVPVVIGRTDNRAGESAVGVRLATVSTHPCDTPGALSRPSAPVFPASFSSFEPDRLGRLAIVRSGVDAERATRAVYELDGVLHVLGETGAGELLGVGVGDPGTVALPPPDGAARLSDPSLLEVDGQVWLYYVVHDDAGASHLQRIQTRAGRLDAFSGAATPLTFSGALAADLREGLVLDGPTVWRDAADSFRMIARVHTDNTTSLVSLVSDDGIDWSLAGGDIAASRVLETRPADLFAFDRDEVAEPAIVVRVGVLGVRYYHLYYAARRGSRWSIGLAVSTDGLLFRRVDSIFEGDASGFDGLSVTSPAPLVRDDGEVDLFYRATDGTTDAYGLARPLR